MPRNFKTQLAGQIGESLVVAELGRRGIVATSFAGNVPDIDILAYRAGKTLSLQVKAIRSGSVSFDAKRYMQLEFQGDRQVIAQQESDTTTKWSSSLWQSERCKGQIVFT